MALLLSVTACGQPLQDSPEATAEMRLQETEAAAPVEPELPLVQDLDDGVTKILSIGSSFTRDTIQHVRHMADSAGSAAAIQLFIVFPEPAQPVKSI